MGDCLRISIPHGSDHPDPRQWSAPARIGFEAEYGDVTVSRTWIQPGPDTAATGGISARILNLVAGTAGINAGFRKKSLTSSGRIAPRFCPPPLSCSAHRWQIQAAIRHSHPPGPFCQRGQLFQQKNCREGKRGLGRGLFDCKRRAWPSSLCELSTIRRGECGYGRTSLLSD